MCGLGGLVTLRSAPDEQTLRRMTKALAHRGPDSEGIAIAGNVGLAHTRLSIVDPTPAGNQPMWDRSKRWCLAYNGEIYNHRALRSEFLNGFPFRGTSDTETLVELLAKYGPGAVRHLRGMFAYAAIDLQNKRLHISRDAFGIKPMYFAQRADGIVFSSEIRGIQAAGFKLIPKIDALRHALGNGWINGATTVFEGVHRVEQGTTLTVDLTTITISEDEWYHPAMAVDAQWATELQRLTVNQTTDLVETELRRAVREQLMSDVPLGTTCSGGIDSSLVTAFARDELATVHAFNVSIADQPERDEGPWAEAVAQKLNVELHTIKMDAELWLGGLVPAVEHYEYPLTYESSIGLAAIAKTAQEVGVKVLLTGEGADEILGGYPWLNVETAADFRARDSALLKSRRWLSRASKTIKRTPNTGALSSISEEATRYHRFTNERCHDAYAHHQGARRQFEGELLGEFRLSLPQILTRGDKNTMQHSVETRVPFLDQELVRLALNMPLEHRIEPLRKNPLAVLADRYLPAGLATRPKFAFNFDVAGYLQSRAKPEFLDNGVLREILKAHGSQWRDSLDLVPYRETMLLWTAEIWARLFVQGESAENVEKDLFGF